MDTIKKYYDNEEQCKIVSMTKAVAIGLDMVHCRYALRWSQDEEDGRWYVEVPMDDTTKTPIEREIIIDTLTAAAEASGLSVPFESFYYEHRSSILSWIINGGDSIRDIFETSTEVWLDMRVDVDSPSPREFALNLLT